ncbi:hypothetical protein V6N11_043963 [Hibiscus sabdariffa]|uniref:Uncharacterized protein n=1 Tax=Hibiscus sabdariffa TaxID=183260 RepID=A0ABR2RE81_9ROSI
MVSKQFVEQIVAAKSLDKIMSTVLVSDTVQGIGCLVLAYALVVVMLCKQSFGPSMVASDMHGVVVIAVLKLSLIILKMSDANNVADWLAKHRRDKEIGEEPFTLPPPGIQRFSTMSATGMVNYGEFLLIWDVFLDLVGRC